MKKPIHISFLSSPLALLFSILVKISLFDLIFGWGDNPIKLDAKPIWKGANIRKIKIKKILNTILLDQTWSSIYHSYIN